MVGSFGINCGVQYESSCIKWSWKKFLMSKTRKKDATLEPMELAKLAAMLGARLSPHDALTQAMALYNEAVEFLEYYQARQKSQFMAQAKNELGFKLEAVSAEVLLLDKNRLKLEPSKNDDQVRQFFAKSGFDVKNGENVLRRFRRLFSDVCSGNADKFIDACKSSQNGETIYRVPIAFLEALVLAAKKRRSETKHRAWQKRRNKKPPVK